MKFGIYLLRMGLLLSLISFCPSYGYDPMDPIGNITIKWDVLEWSGDNAYSARISIYNYQLYRQVGSPGWRYGWSWQKKDVLINDARGAEATEQGDCSKFTPRPHSCVQRPVMVDLLPGTPYNMQTQNCCKGGVLSTVGQDPSRHLSSFTVSVGNSPANSTPEFLPINHTLGLPGYSCAEPTVVRPTRSTTNGRRWTQAAMTWTVICSYSQYLASPSPTCCVSLSSFYNETLTPCPHCSCACPRTDPESHKCIDGDDPPYLLRLPRSDAFGEVRPVVRCTQHMCPVRVHWHVKLSYKEYWRVKLTINNFNYIHNYSNWNLVIQHPNLESINQIFSFNYLPLLQYGDINDTGMFWGINYYNDMLLHAGDEGNVQTEILLRKDAGIFTFDAGWAFPRRVYFNGDECVMPPPGHFPRLPNESSSGRLYVHYLFLDVIVCLMMVLFLS